MTRVLLVEYTCLHCGRGDTLEVLNLHELPPARPPCSACSGPVLAADVEQVSRQDKIDPIEWSAEKPRRGRPPRALQERSI